MATGYCTSKGGAFVARKRHRVVQPTKEEYTCICRPDIARHKRYMDGYVAAKPAVYIPLDGPMPILEKIDRGENG